MNKDSAAIMAKIYDTSKEKPLSKQDLLAAKKFLAESTNKILAENNLVVSNF